MENTLTKTRVEIPSFEEFLENVKKHPPKSRDEIIMELRQTITQYEQKYQMSTEEFIPRFEKGEFENDDNYVDHELFRWWSDYHSYIKLFNKEEA